VSDDNTSRLTRKGRATRARIVDVAARLMFEHGVAGTSIEEVRNTAAVSGSQISHYFHDKGDLTRQVIATRCNDVQEFHTQPQLGALDSLDAIIELIRASRDREDAREQLVARFAFGQRTTLRETIGMVLVVAGVVLLILAY